MLPRKCQMLSFMCQNNCFDKFESIEIFLFFLFFYLGHCHQPLSSSSFPLWTCDLSCFRPQALAEAHGRGQLPSLWIHDVSLILAFEEFPYFPASSVMHFLGDVLKGISGYHCIVRKKYLFQYSELPIW